MENHLSEPMAALFGGFPFIPDDEGYLTLMLPFVGGTGNMSWIGIERDYGDIVHAVLLEPEAFDKTQVDAISSINTLEDLVTKFEKGENEIPIEFDYLANSVIVTGKRSRYVGFDWKTLETQGSLEAETVKGIFGLSHTLDAEFTKTFLDNSKAKVLKAKGAAARGCKGKDTEPQTLDEFLAKYFAA